jgi:hypothetical protein
MALHRQTQTIFRNGALSGKQKRLFSRACIHSQRTSQDRYRDTQQTQGLTRTLQSHKRWFSQFQASHDCSKVLRLT